MVENAVYLVTGGNRGIGYGITQALLLRENTTVVATVRDSATDISALQALPVEKGSNLLLTYLSISTTCSPSIETATNALATALKTHKITKINTLIASAGLGTDFHSSENTSLESLLTHFHANTLGPTSLYQSLLPFLRSAEEAKFVVISSSLGSIGCIEAGVPGLAYGVSKVAVNFLVRKVHFEEGEIVSLAVHPGWVKTQNGQNFANSIGVAEPPMTLEESVKGVLKQIGQATKSTTSGCFVSYDGKEIPW